MLGEDGRNQSKYSLELVAYTLEEMPYYGTSNM
jgi:hypothetical protein